MARSGMVTGLHDVAVSDHAETVARRIARTWTLSAISLFAVLALTVGIPHGPDLENWERQVQLGTLAVLAIGGIVAWWSEGIGGATMLIGAGALWGMGALQHQPIIAFLPALLFFVPAIGFLVAWKRTRSMASLIALGMTVVIVLSVGGATAYAAYQRGYGPSHPQSNLPALPETPVVWIWSGAVTDTSATVAAAISDGDRVALELAGEGGEFRTVTGRRVGDTWRFDIADLAPETRYTYVAVVDGNRFPERSGEFTTFSAGTESFTVAAASCARLGSNGVVYETIAGLEPDLFISTGDLFYVDYAATAAQFDQAYKQSLSQPAQSAMFTAIPIAYIWDDHDVGRNDANSTTESLPSALAAYQQNVPHYPLVAPDGVYQSFSIGRVLFVLLDERSYRDPQSESDGPGKTMLGAQQLEWLQDMLLTGRDDFSLTVIVGQVPWIAAAEPGADHWGGYAFERERIANFIADNEIHDLVMVAGDSHMVAIDDGSHTDYSTSGNASFPMLQAAALDRPGTLKGGPYSEGAFLGGGQFGLIEVADNGDSLTVRLAGVTWEDEVLVEYIFTAGAS